MTVIASAAKQSRIPPRHRLLCRYAPFHEPDLTDPCFEYRLPLTPTPLQRGEGTILSLYRFAGEGWGEGGPRFKTCAIHGS